MQGCWEGRLMEQPQEGWRGRWEPRELWMPCTGQVLHPVGILGSPRGLLSKDPLIVWGPECSAAGHVPQRQRQGGKGFRPPAPISPRALPVPGLSSVLPRRRPAQSPCCPGLSHPPGLQEWLDQVEKERRGGGPGRPGHSIVTAWDSEALWISQPSHCQSA